MTTRDNWHWMVKRIAHTTRLDKELAYSLQSSKVLLRSSHSDDGRGSAFLVLYKRATG